MTGRRPWGASPRTREALRELEGLLQHATARGRAADCVSRSFAPKCGVPEDPVCGSGHCHIFLYWARVLGKDTLVAWQASPRGGTLYGTLEGGRVKLSGKAVIFAATTFFLPGASLWACPRSPNFPLRPCRMDRRGRFSARQPGCHPWHCVV